MIILALFNVFYIAQELHLLENVFAFFYELNCGDTKTCQNLKKRLLKKQKQSKK